jgi:hypothetical protein
MRLKTKLVDTLKHWCNVETDDTTKHEDLNLVFATHGEENEIYDNEEEEGSVSHVKHIQYDEIDLAPDIPRPMDGNTQEASKTHGTLPGAHQTSPAKGAVTEPATDAGGDKEVMQSMSVAEVG